MIKMTKPINPAHRAMFQGAISLLNAAELNKLYGVNLNLDQWMLAWELLIANDAVQATIKELHDTPSTRCGLGRCDFRKSKQSKPLAAVAEKHEPQIADNAAELGGI
jgi:hypothetical protein